MKITDLTITLHKREPLRGNYPVPSQAGGGSLQLQPFAVMTIETDEGVVGHAFLGSSAGASEALVSQVVKLIKPGLIGRNPLDIGAIWQSLWKRNRMLDTQAIGAIDVALWDIAGKVANLPIHRLLGTCRDRVPVYASFWLLPRAEGNVQEALHYRDLGWKAYKIHPRFVAKEDIKLCAAVRQAVGDDMGLMLDAARSYGYEEALRVGLVIEDLGYYWYEDPLAETDLQGIQWEWQAVDGAMTKAPFAGAATGANTTARGKKGVKRSLLTDGAGIPLALAIEGANRHDMRTALCDVGWHGHRPCLRQPRRNRSTCVWMLDMIPQLSVSKSKLMTLFLTCAGVGKNSRRKLPRRAFGVGDGWWNARIPGSIGLVVFWCALEKKVENYLAFLHLACAQLMFAKVFPEKEVCLPSAIAPGRRNSSLSK